MMFGQLESNLQILCHFFLSSKSIFFNDYFIEICTWVSVIFFTQKMMRMVIGFLSELYLNRTAPGQIMVEFLINFIVSPREKCVSKKYDQIHICPESKLNLTFNPTKTCKVWDFLFLISRNYFALKTMCLHPTQLFAIYSQNKKNKHELQCINPTTQSSVRIS